MSDIINKKKYEYNRLCASITFKDDEMQLIDKIVAEKFKNKNQFIECLVRDYMKKYTENKQADSNIENNNIIVDNQNNNNNNNISIDKLNNSIDALNQTITNLVSLINKNSDENIKKGTVN